LTAAGKDRQRAASPSPGYAQHVTGLRRDAQITRDSFCDPGVASLSWPALAEQDKIGVAAEVNPDVTAQVPDGQKRELLVGHDVIHNEKISTGNGGQAQLLFTDQSTLTVAKNSEVVIDDFVFDPQKQNGNLTATLTTGVFRYVGGKISKQQDVTFYTPTGTVSVRGGIALIKIDGDTITAVFLHGDHMYVTSHGVSQTTDHRMGSCRRRTTTTPSSSAPQAVSQSRALLPPNSFRR
jgi:hypothetical protein